jgi:SAM-dependent methyltransferase
VTSPHDMKDLINNEPEQDKGTLDLFGPDEFSRDDETDDLEFYKTPHVIGDLDSLAFNTVQDLYLKLIPAGSHVLELLADSVTYLPASLECEEITGIGFSEQQMSPNTRLTTRIVRDLNKYPLLPFPENRFNVIIQTLSIEYLTRPVEIFQEAARVLCNGGVFIEVFSNRMFMPKSVKIWKTTAEAARIDLVKKYFEAGKRFYLDGTFESKGQPRPSDDKYYSLGIPSDPVYAIWGKVVK